MKTTISLREYLKLVDNQGSFVIPNYQRGYVWGQTKKNQPVDSVTYLIKAIERAFKDSKEIFLQGITVHKKEGTKDLYLVDGQQRTTFFYLLLKYLGYKDYLKIEYEIRKESDEFLQQIDLSSITQPDEKEPFQDLFFFKKSLYIFSEELKDIDKKSYLNFILDRIKFLIVFIPEGQAKTVFTMMNGNKALMEDEELIKAELLRCASLKHDIIGEAEHSELRSRLAREWDGWLQWWNDEEVKKFFRTDGRQLGWLLPLICEKSAVSFADFRKKLLGKQSIKEAKEVFRKLRLLQKSIEDIYYNSVTYNYFGVILYIRNTTEQRFAFLRWFFDQNSQEAVTHSKSMKELKRYYDWAIINVNHEDIVNRNLEKWRECREDFRSKLESNSLFRDNYEVAYRWLLRQNIKEDNRFQTKGGRRFDFSIERDRSLEHIYPKSKIGHKGNNNMELDWEDRELDEKHREQIKLWREDMKWTNNNHVYDGSEHCIGNLVLLYKRDNSKFNDADFEKKNEYFFTDFDDDGLKSRHLIHSTMIFSNTKWNNWNPEQIPRRKQEEIECFLKEYPEPNNYDNA